MTSMSDIIFARNSIKFIECAFYIILIIKWMII
ncbi:hypothetical protein ESCOMMO224M_23330 [Escherichia coli]